MTKVKHNERVMGSPAFIRLSRNPDLPVPVRFEPTKKEPDHVVI